MIAFRLISPEDAARGAKGTLVTALSREHALLCYPVGMLVEQGTGAVVRAAVAASKARAAQEETLRMEEAEAIAKSAEIAARRIEEDRLAQEERLQLAREELADDPCTPPIFWGFFESLADVFNNWDGAEYALLGCEVLYAGHDGDAYGGEAFALWRRFGKLYEANDRHGSDTCLDNFTAEETSIEAILMRQNLPARLRKMLETMQEDAEHDAACEREPVNVVHEVDGEFVISSNQIWLPGCYESREAAENAFRFCVDHQVRLRDDAIAMHNGVITLAAMTLLEAEAGLSCGQCVQAEDGESRCRPAEGGRRCETHYLLPLYPSGLCREEVER